MTSTAPSGVASARGSRPSAEVATPPVATPGKRTGFANELREIRVNGLAIQDLRSGDLRQDAVAQHGDLLAHRQGFRLIMRHQQRGGSGGGQRTRDSLTRLDAQAGVQGRERLVEQHQSRRWRERAGERHALLLTP